MTRLKHLRECTVLGALVGLAVAYSSACSSEGAVKDPLCESGVTGTVEIERYDLGFSIGGRISDLTISAGQQVSEGQVLATLGTGLLKAELDERVAVLNFEEATLSELTAGPTESELNQADALVRQAMAILELAESDLSRVKLLFDGGAIGLDSLETVQSRVNIAKEDVQKATQRSKLLRAGPTEQALDAQSSRVQAARQAVAESDLKLDETAIRSPRDGVVSELHKAKGESATPGEPVLTLIDPSERWIWVEIPAAALETEFQHREVTIELKSDPNETFLGRFEDVLEGSASRGSTRPATAPYRVKIRVIEDREFRLKANTSAKVRICGASSA